MISIFRNLKKMDKTTKAENKVFNFRENSKHCTGKGQRGATLIGQRMGSQTLSQPHGKLMNRAQGCMGCSIFTSQDRESADTYLQFNQETEV